MAASSRPYPVCQSAPTEPTWTTACTTPAPTSHTTASAAQRDQAGRITPSTRGWARRSRNTDKRDQPAEPDRHRRHVHHVGRHDQRAGQRRHRSRARSAARWPGRRARARPARRRGPRPAVPAQHRRAAARRPAASTASRAVSVNAVRAGQHVGQLGGGDVPQRRAGAVRRLQPEPPSGGQADQRQAGVRTSRTGPRRDSRRGQSRARNSAGPTVSVSPAYPRNLSVGTAAATERMDLARIGLGGPRRRRADREDERARRPGGCPPEIIR